MRFRQPSQHVTEISGQLYLNHFFLAFPELTLLTPAIEPLLMRWRGSLTPPPKFRVCGRSERLRP